ncbi:MAG: hypothetical protein EOP84_35520, partial [Verrucomicrobiaceae bacterium]
MNLWQFARTRDRWFLSLSALFGLVAARDLLRLEVFKVALVVTIIWSAWLAIGRYGSKNKSRRLFGNPDLRPLDPNEKQWRRTLSKSERENLEIWELLTEKRFPLSEALEFVERHREANREDDGTDPNEAEKAAYLAEQQFAEMEKKELAVSSVSRAMKVLEPETGKLLWLKLQAVDDGDDDDLAFAAPVRCTIWSEEPTADGGGSASFASLGAVIGFPPDADAATPMFWESAPLKFKRMFRSRCLIDGICVANDSRERFELRIGDQVYTIMTKYLYWRTDVALDPDRQSLWVRISEMLSEGLKRSAEGEGGEDAGFHGMARIPAFVYRIPIARLLPSAHP